MRTVCRMRMMCRCRICSWGGIIGVKRTINHRNIHVICTCWTVKIIQTRRGSSLSGRKDTQISNKFNMKHHITRTLEHYLMHYIDYSTHLGMLYSICYSANWCFIGMTGRSQLSGQCKSGSTPRMTGTGWLWQCGSG